MQFDMVKNTKIMNEPIRLDSNLQRCNSNDFKELSIQQVFLINSPDESYLVGSNSNRSSNLHGY